MRYRVEVEEERTGRLVYQDSRVSEYRGGDVDYSNTTSSLLDHGYYTALVFLHTGGQNISSFPFRLLNSKYYAMMFLQQLFAMQVEGQRKLLRRKAVELVN